MADVTSIYGNPIKDAVARANISTLQTDVQDVKDGLSDLEAQIIATLITDTASGAIASFPDGAAMPVKSLTVAIEPVQDLHGYDYPWPAGGGKNKLHVTAVTQTSNGVTFTVNEDGTVKVNGTATANTYLYLGDSSLSALAEGSYILSGSPSGGAYASYGLQINDGSWKFDYGSGASFTKGSTLTGVAIRIANGYTANNLLFKPMIRLSSVSDATFAPYENICPISGHTSAKVTRTGANVWDEVWEVGGINQDGTNAPANDIIRSKNYIPVAPNTAYYCTYGNADKIYECFFYGPDKSHISNAVLPSTGVVTTPSNCGYMRFRCRASYGATYKNDLSINYPATVTTYNAYNSQTVTIDLDGTRYGGSLDVGTGVLTVDRQIVDMTAFANTWNVDTSHERAYITLSGAYTPTSQPANIVCNRFATVTAASIYDKTAFGVGMSEGKALQFRIDGVTTVSGATAATVTNYFANNPTQLVYPIASPFTVQLTANEISTVLGQNNVWNDCGDTTVEYRADTKLYINKMLNA